MRRQLERRKRDRETVDPVILKLIESIGGNGANAVHESQNAQDRLRMFLLTFVPEGLPDRIQGNGLDRLCLTLGCSTDDIVRIARTVPRSGSTNDCVFLDELSFAVLKVLAPVDVRERRRTGCVGEVNESSSPIIPFYKSRFLWKDGENEWAAFLQSLSTPLPMTFRLHCSEPSLTALAKFHVSQPPLADVVEQVSMFRAAAAADASSPLQMVGCSHEAYHNNAACEMWARTLHAASCVSFQEVVSALPVAALNPHRVGAVLDMCAAPGSKSLQALDCILRHGWDQTANSVVWLNEKDRTKATQTLPARLKRYHAPNLIITRCDATQLPRMYVPSGSENTEAQPELKEKRFDFIVCDVPCSGDGTIRKERSVLSSWSTKYVESLVPTQKSLLRRAIDLLAIGGVVVYSTCSLNPAEDEEVVAAALSTFGNAVELLDVNELLRGNLVEGLRSVGGIAVPIGDPDSGCGMLDQSKVLRVFPHGNDTGGFFIAALRKVAFPNMSPPTVIQSKLNQWMNHRRWVIVPHADDTHWRCIMEFFGIDVCAEATLLQHFRPVFNVNPNGGPQRRIVFVTPAVEEMVFKARPFKGPGVELIAIGMRAFEAYDGKYMQGSPCNWRAVTESASRIARFATRRKIVLNASAEGDAHLLKSLLTDGQIGMEAFCQHRADAFDDPVWWQTLAEGLRVVISGSVLLGVCGGPAKLTGDTTWWLSCTINRSKMELAVDESMRTFGLLSFFGIACDRNAQSGQVAGEDDVLTTEETV